MHITTRQIGNMWNYIIQNDLIAFAADWHLLSQDSAGAIIVDLVPESRKPRRLRLEPNGGVTELEWTALEEPISSDETPEDGETAVSTAATMGGPSSKEIADRARAGREAQERGAVQQREPGDDLPVVPRVS